MNLLNPRIFARSRAETAGSAPGLAEFDIHAPSQPREDTGARTGARPSRPYFSLEGLTIAYDGLSVVKDLAFAAERGEFVTLLGPSGCGKTTILRSIAGFISPVRGRIFVDNTDITDVPVHRRNIGMVFQSYALFPHLSVLENVAFGLRMRHVAQAEREDRAVAALQMVGLPRLAERYPSQLSGGQQQRVALARALVVEPAILLLDEPLSNLDSNLRAELRDEIRALQKRLAILTILVTHDQQEAFAVSDRIAIMNEGRIVDIGPPQALSDHPRDAFAAAFIGGRTVLPGSTREGVFRGAGFTCAGAPDAATRIVLRSTRLALNRAGGDLSLSGQVVGRTYLGDYYEVEIETPSGRMRVIVRSDTPPPELGETCSISALPGGVSFMS